jgi:hypothetical protein
MAADSPSPQLSTLWRFLLVSVVGNFAWEVLQLPLYTLWFEGTPQQVAFAVVHCTGGDALIASATLFIAWGLFGRGWPLGQISYRNVAIAAICLGIAYTIYSEWLNVNVRGAWSYSVWMLRLPPLGTGLSPILQWLVVPASAFAWARPRHVD